ncbi:hypothetical protein K2173_025835 [Erythroxylum novogranatense]|uniref:Translation initiation factor beta propellor-like domain-containing protein n=1 Tax=Erythroxylum novogranatense TaxID=1862640 RepID=A0AAV8SHX6_9ROSI|nr:hypothetical protein K2173_025835 [Erythroxylum novogranatense]
MEICLKFRLNFMVEDLVNFWYRIKDNNMGLWNMKLFEKYEKGLRKTESQMISRSVWLLEVYFFTLQVWVRIKAVVIFRNFDKMRIKQLKPDPVYEWTVVWGGATSFDRLMRYAHPQVKLIDFSLGEKYLMTHSNHKSSNPRDANARWGGGMDEKYFAKLGKNIISVYKTETFSLIGKKSLKVENIMDFIWSLSDPIISLFVPELGGGNQPTRKSTHPGFELFRIKERDILIEVLELDNKNDKIVAFPWEPKGQRFAIIHGDSPRSDVSFYSMKTAHNSQQANALFWSPAGHFIVLTGLKGFNGQLEFYNVDELETMAMAEHFMAGNSFVASMHVVTSVTSVHHEMENGFNVWSFNGNLLYRILKNQFFLFLWLPRLPSFLGPEKEEEIHRREKRRALTDEWDKWISKCKRLHEEEKLERQKLRDGDASDEEEEYEAKEIEVEEIVDMSEEVVSFEYAS